MKLFQKKADGSQDGLAINRISKKANAVLNTVFLLWALACVLPLSKPGLATIGLFTTIACWNDWFLGMLYIVDQKKYPVQTLLWSMQNSLEFMKQSSTNALEYAEMAANAPTDSGRMALTVLVVLPILLVYPFFQKYFIKGLTVGGGKG